MNADGAQGEILIPGDKLLDGTVLKSAKCAGRTDAVYYTSQTIRYSGLKFYAEPQEFMMGSTRMEGSVVLQCRPGFATFGGQNLLSNQGRKRGATCCDR